MIWFFKDFIQNHTILRPSSNQKREKKGKPEEIELSKISDT